MSPLKPILHRAFNNPKLLWLYFALEVCSGFSLLLKLLPHFQLFNLPHHCSALGRIILGICPWEVLPFPLYPASQVCVCRWGGATPYSKTSNFSSFLKGKGLDSGRTFLSTLARMFASYMECLFSGLSPMELRWLPRHYHFPREDSKAPRATVGEDHGPKFRLSSLHPARCWHGLLDLYLFSIDRPQATRSVYSQTLREILVWLHCSA